VWIGLHEPSEDVLEQVQREFGLHDLAVEDAHNAHQRPKVEMYGDSLFVVLRTAQISKEHHIEFGETHFFVGSNYIVTVRHGSSISYADVRSRCENSPQMLNKGPGFALYAIMDFIVDQYNPVVNQMEMELETIEDKVFKERPSRETTEQIYQLKRELLDVKMDLLLVVGGYNSSNTSHLAEMGEEKLPTYFVLNASRLVSANEIQHYNLHEKREVVSHFWLPPGPVVVGITAGASCPNNLIEETLIRLFELRGIPREQLELAA